MSYSLRDLPRFFATWDSKPYAFIDEEVAKRHERLTCTPRPSVVLTEMKETLSRYYDVNSLDIAPRSKYRPEMLLEPCRRFERGGDYPGINWSAFKSAVSRVERMFVLKHKVKPIALSDVPFEGNKNSGLPFLRKKEDVYEESLERAKQCVRGACPPPVTIFHRGKNTDVARPVFAFPFEWHLVEGKFFYPLQDLIVGANTPYFVGKSSCATAGKLNEISASPFVMEMDYSGFDGSLSGLLIASSFRILKKNLILSDNQDDLWERVSSYFVTSPFLAPDARVYFGRRHGVPSGSMFTQLIDTICNAIIIEYISIRLNYSLGMYICVGDDSVTSFDDRPDLQDVHRTAKEIGITVSLDKTTVHDTSEEFNIHFLGHYWDKGYPTRPIEETLVRLLAPERIRREYFSKDEAVRLTALRERIRAYQEDNGSAEAWRVLHALEKHYVYPRLGSGMMIMWPINPDRFWNLPMEVTGFDRWQGRGEEVRRLNRGSRSFVRAANLFV